MATVANGVDLTDLLPVEGENHIGSASMQTAASNKLFLIASYSFERFAGFEELPSFRGLYQAIAEDLIKACTRIKLSHIAQRALLWL